MRIADLMLFVVRRRDEGLEYSFRKGTLDGLLMAQGYIAQTLLKKPKSPLQRYRLLREGEGGPGMNTTYTVKHIQKGMTLFDEKRVREKLRRLDALSSSTVAQRPAQGNSTPL